MGHLLDLARRGADVVANLSAEGLVFVASAGSETTPLTAVAYDKDQPEITISVPSTHILIPIRVEVRLESYAGTDNEIIVWRTTNAIAAGTSTAMTEGPTNLYTSGKASVATARVLHTANVTQTGYIELWSAGQALADTNPGTFIYKPEELVLLKGGTLGVQIAGTSTQPTFYAKVTYAEVPASWVE